LRFDEETCPMRLRPAFLSAVLLSVLLGLVTFVGADPTTVPTTAPAAALEPADVAAPKLGSDGQLNSHFKKKHEEFLQRRTEGPIDLLFLGDSITEGWSGRGKAVWQSNYADLNAANFGIGGDRTQHVLWRIDNGELDGISPKVLVLLIGTNNIGYSAEEILAGDTKIIAEIHEKLPQTKLLIIGIFPRGADPSDPTVAEMRAKIITVNKGLATLDDGNKTRFLDLGDKFLTPDGKITRDFMYDAVALHPNAAGYQLWADAMKPLLAEMLK
jgi:lysophospholipase L1-like esterase